MTTTTAISTNVKPRLRFINSLEILPDQILRMSEYRVNAEAKILLALYMHIGQGDGRGVGDFKALKAGAGSG